MRSVSEGGGESEWDAAFAQRQQRGGALRGLEYELEFGRARAISEEERSALRAIENDYERSLAEATNDTEREEARRVMLYRRAHALYEAEAAVEAERTRIPTPPSTMVVTRPSSSSRHAESEIVQWYLEPTHRAGGFKPIFVFTLENDPEIFMELEAWLASAGMRGMTVEFTDNDRGEETRYAFYLEAGIHHEAGRHIAGGRGALKRLDPLRLSWRPVGAYLVHQVVRMVEPSKPRHAGDDNDDDEEARGPSSSHSSSVDPMRMSDAELERRARDIPSSDQETERHANEELQNILNVTRRRLLDHPAWTTFDVIYRERALLAIENLVDDFYNFRSLAPGESHAQYHKRLLREYRDHLQAITVYAYQLSLEKEEEFRQHAKRIIAREERRLRNASPGAGLRRVRPGTEEQEARESGAIVVTTTATPPKAQEAAGGGIEEGEEGSLTKRPKGSLTPDGGAVDVDAFIGFLINSLVGDPDIYKAGADAKTDAAVKKFLVAGVERLGHRCGHCHRDGCTMRCKQCKKMCYCDKDCQRENWGSHKHCCSMLQETTTTAAAAEAVKSELKK